MVSGVGAATRLSQERWGAPSRPQFDVVSTSTTVAELVRNRADRVALLLQNIGSAAVFVWFDPSVSTTRGFRLAPQGGTLGFVLDEDGEVTTAELWAVAASGTPEVSILETIVEGRHGAAE